MVLKTGSEKELLASLRSCCLLQPARVLPAPWLLLSAHQLGQRRHHSLVLVEGEHNSPLRCVEGG
jgi:hypothetical protein